MKSKLGFAMIMILAVMMLVQFALAEECHFTFVHNGVTYNEIHHAEEVDWFETLNPMPISYSDDLDAWELTYSDAYSAFLAAEAVATRAHMAQHHSNDLGDESLPVILLCGCAVLAVVGAVAVHKKRTSIG